MPIFSFTFTFVFPVKMIVPPNDVVIIAKTVSISSIHANLYWLRLVGKKSRLTLQVCLS